MSRRQLGGKFNYAQESLNHKLRELGGRISVVQWRNIRFDGSRQESKRLFYLLGAVKGYSVSAGSWRMKLQQTNIIMQCGRPAHPRH